MVALIISATIFDHVKIHNKKIRNERGIPPVALLNCVKIKKKNIKAHCMWNEPHSNSQSLFY